MRTITSKNQLEPFLQVCLRSPQQKEEQVSNVESATNVHQQAPRCYHRVRRIKLH